jgi:hypothetical protein
MHGETRRENPQLLPWQYLHDVLLRALSYKVIGIMSITVRCPNLGLHFIRIKQSTDGKICTIFMAGF